MHARKDKYNKPGHARKDLEIGGDQMIAGIIGPQ